MLDLALEIRLISRFVSGVLGQDRFARVEEDVLCRLESLEERHFLSALASRTYALAPREGARVLPEPVGAEQLAADWTDERLLPTIRCAR